MRAFRLPSIISSILCLIVLAVAPAKAGYPDKPIKIIVPFAPGGGTDIISRVLADVMSKDLDTPVIVENKPGAGTIVGSSAAANSAGDGYTLLMATFANAVNPSIYAKMPFDMFKAFTPVALVARSFNIVVVNPKLPFKSLQDVIAYAKANPGKLNYGSFGIGTSAHLAGELFKTLAHVDLTHVPYKGAAPAITDLLSGQIQIMFTTVASAAAYVQGGQLRALAVTSKQRSPAFPDLPTVAEAGVPDFAAESWYGLYAPAGTPADVIARLNASVAKAIRSGTFSTLEKNEGLTFAPRSPDDLDRYVKGEAARWHTVVQSAHIKPQ
ncbi:MAG: Bug family tripartite tricarboxylate transporter substrate binding protein [Pseudolabrys sp.]